MIGLGPYTRRLVPIHRLDDLELNSFDGQIKEWEEEMAQRALMPIERIEKHILLLRGEKVMLDSDLADLYGVETKVLVRTFKRNIERFPDDFMFQLSPEEFDNLRRQSGTSSSHGGRRTAPYAFTEQGVAMLSSVLRSDRAVQVNVQIMRTFVRLRQMLSSKAELTRKLPAMENKYDHKFKIVFDAIRALMEEAEASPKRSRIGFQTEVQSRR